ncbi:hypothetical protein TBR22_A49290 [Luteitalea sp. TBR-22]|uniref:heavy-metal-associated domain-containing protein n=1 Tax=Luteitalea sp. TBR-22 TaxID=2802971 RepID=UPI001AFA62AA|nr:hypothetical protein TBR22_A49290 [Luteitalea sp. TBR-22]
MSCDACVRHVTRALDGIAGVVDVNVDLDTARAIVTTEPGRVRVEELILAIEHAGYGARAVVTGDAAASELPDPYARAGGCCRTRN